MTTAALDLPTASNATRRTSTTMKALVYHGPAKYAWEDKLGLVQERLTFSPTSFRQYRGK
jgi:hypothetical protein